MNIIIWQKKWSGQNWTSRTGSAALDKATNLLLYYIPNNHFTTNDAYFVQVETNYNF